MASLLLTSWIQCGRCFCFDSGFDFGLGLCAGPLPAFRVRWVMKWRLCLHNFWNWHSILFFLFFTVVLSVSSAHHYPYHDVSVFFTRRVNLNAQRTTEIRNCKWMHWSEHFVSRWYNSDSSLRHLKWKHFFLGRILRNRTSVTYEEGEYALDFLLFFAWGLSPRTVWIVIKHNR